MEDVSDHIRRPVENGQIGIIDPDSRAIGFYIYDGLFIAIPLDNNGQPRDTFNTKIEETVVLDIKF
jgi:hypothetical protein